uniref:Solute carrier family 25 member 48 n=1 Tax=Fundulus heteroclitus TaxID=8078 RepID=A0A3Q2QR11_FUNHE
MFFSIQQSASCFLLLVHSVFSVSVYVCVLTAGASSVVVGHPLDTVKTRLQAGKGYQSTLHCILTIYRKETVAGFFKGMSFPLASITVYNSVVFGFFSNTQRLISKYRYGDGRHPSGMLDLTVASMLTGLMSVGLGAPVDLVKIRLQMQTQMVLAGKSVFHSLAVHPGGGVFFFFFLLFLNGGVFRHQRPPACIHCNGSISWVTATPADVVKSRMQADAQLHRKYKGVLHCIVQSYRTEGAEVFFRGASVNAIRGFPMSSTMFLMYELSLQFFRGH